MAKFQLNLNTMSVERKRSKPRVYRATYPSGETWEFSRLDLEIPQVGRDGEQDHSVIHCFSSLRDAINQMAWEGCKVELVK